MFNVEFYETVDGKQPVVEFLDSLEVKMTAKIVSLMEVLEERGNELRHPYSGPLGEGIFELRCKQASNISRVLYFFYNGRRIVFTNGFVKKTNKTPKKEVELAKARREDWIRRNANMEG